MALTPPPQTPPQPQGITIAEAIAQAYGHWNAGQPGQAEFLCQQVLALWPEHPDALHLLGLLAHTHGNLALAIDFLRRACATPRAPAEFHSNLAEMLRQNAQLAAAEASARMAVAQDPAQAGGWNNLGIILQESGKLEESLQCLQRVCVLEPDNAESRNNLGNTYRRLGRLDDARREYDAAITLNPTYSEAYSNLSHLLCELRVWDQAAAAARTAIDLNPRNADAYINAAGIALAQGRMDKAERWLDNAHSFAPHHVGVLLAKVRLLVDADRTEEAETLARQAAALAPDSGEPLCQLGHVLAVRGMPEEAVAAYDRACTLPVQLPGTPQAGKALVLMELGRKAQALAQFDHALSINPHLTSAWLNRSDLKTFTADDPDIAQMEGLLNLPPPHTPAPADAMVLGFALGKAWMDAGDGARAFAHFHAANALKRATYDYDADRTDAWLDDIAAAFTPDLMERLARAGDGDERPVFIVGMPRSGTTLVEQILASHPAIHGAGELRLLQTMLGRIAGPDLQPLGYPRLLGTLQPHDCAALGRHYAERAGALAHGARRVVDKMPSNFLYAGLIHLILPQARIIHCRRDPVDTCLSCYTKLFAGDQNFAYDLRELGRFHLAHDRLAAHWRAILPESAYLAVDYERVVADLEGEARRLVAFCGLEWDPACLSFHQTQRQIRTASLTQVRSPLYASSVGRWQAYAPHLAPLLETLNAARPTP